MAKNPYELRLVKAQSKAAANLEFSVLIKNISNESLKFAMPSGSTCASLTFEVRDENGQVVTANYPPVGMALQSEPLTQQLSPNQDLEIGNWTYTDLSARGSGGTIAWWDFSKFRRRKLTLVGLYNCTCSKQSSFQGQVQSDAKEIKIPDWNSENIAFYLEGEPVTDPTAANLLRSSGLGSHNAKVKGHAALSLGQIHDLKSLATLCSLLSDKDRDVRGYAARALESLGSKKALDCLVNALMRKDPDSWVQQNMASALTTLCGSPTLESTIGSFVLAGGNKNIKLLKKIVHMRDKRKRNEAIEKFLKEFQKQK